MPEYTVILTVEVPDEEALFRAAMKRLTEQDGLPRDEAEDLLRGPRGDLRPEQCLLEMLDPGPSGTLPFEVTGAASTLITSPPVASTCKP